MVARGLAVLLTIPLLAGCDLRDTLEWQALRLFLAVNPNLELGDGPVPIETRSERLLLKPVVDDLEFPWDLAFPDAETVLVTEKPGRLSRITLASGDRTPIAGVPEVAFVGQGGLLGIELHPKFGDNGWLYLSHSIELPGERYTTRLARARLVGDRLEQLEVLLTAEPAFEGHDHFGGALEFDREGTLYLSVGERQQRDEAQALGSHLGKILRLHDDGSIPEDNPFLGTDGARPEIFSFGHRNPQGLALDPTSGALWSAEHGPRGGDEVNVLRAGHNYGWPIISHGEEYAGGPVGVGTHREGLEQPVHYYVPSIATAGIGFYTGSDMASWTGNLFVAGLLGTHLDRLRLDGERVVDTEPLFEDLWHRVRAVRESPAQVLYVLTENGVLLRVDSAGSR